MSPEKIKELREKFFKECTDQPISIGFGLPKLNMVPHDQFQWIVDNVIKAKEEVKSIETELRDKHGIYIWVMPVGIENETVGFWWEVEVSNSDFNMISERDYTKYKTYNDAMNDAIKQALKLVPKQ